MRKAIEGKHLNKTTTVSMKTGKETKSNGKMFLMPAAQGKCQDCAVDHKPEDPHNAQSLFYQYKFYNEEGRWPNWKDAMSHCSEEMKSKWLTHLKKFGVDVEAGNINPINKKTTKEKK